MLFGAAGGPVKEWPLVLIWVVLICAVAGLAYLSARRDEGEIWPWIGVSSGLYWLVVLPVWFSHRRGSGRQ